MKTLVLTKELNSLVSSKFLVNGFILDNPNAHIFSMVIFDLTVSLVGTTVEETLVRVSACYAHRLLEQKISALKRWL
jgi:hypothetical protein